MIADAIKKLQNLIEKGTPPSIRRIGHRNIIISHAAEEGGNIHTALEVEPRDDTAYSARHLLRLIGQLPENDTVIIYVSTTAATAVLDVTDRADRVTMPLEETDEIAAIDGLGEGMGQSEMVKVLRTTLADHFPGLASAIEHIEWHRTESQQTTQQAMGKNVAKRVAGRGPEIPETVETTVTYYDVEDINTETNLRLAVYVDFDHHTISLVPIRGWEYYRTQALRAVVTTLEEFAGPEADAPTIVYGKAGSARNAVHIHDEH